MTYRTPRKNLENNRTNNISWLATTHLDKGFEIKIKEFKKITEQY